MAPLRGQRRTQFGRIIEAAVGTNIQNMESEPEGTGRRPQVSRQNLGTWRFGNFLFPFWTQVPNGEFGRHVQVRGWVPLDDEHTMYCVLWWKRGVSAMTQHTPAFKDGAPIGGMGRRNDFLPNTTDWLGRWRLAANASNDWHIDRTA